MGWGYDNANLAGQFQIPHTRWSIARSSDYGETWEFIGSTHEFTRVANEHMNMDINITDDYIVQNAHAVASSNTDDRGGRYIVLAGISRCPPCALDNSI